MSAAQNSQVSVAIPEKKGEPVSRLKSMVYTPGSLSAVLFIGAFLLYSPLNGFEFINYDDQFYVTENYVVQKGLTLEGVKWAFTTFTASNWHPLTWLSHMLDIQLLGMNPAGQHYVNLLLHSLNVALLFLFLAFMTGKMGRSFIVAALFAVHPLSVESVMWIAERKNLLCTLFFILALMAHVWYVRNVSWKRYVALMGIYLMALMSKPMVVTFPFVLLLLDYWPLRRFGPGITISPSSETRNPIWDWHQFGNLVLEKTPVFMFSIASSAITFFVQRQEGAVAVSLPLWTRLANALLSYGRYLWKIIWPVKLCIFYPHPKLALPWGEVMLSTIAVVIITLLAVILYRTASYLTVGWFWFLGTLVPVIGIVQAGSQAMADRYAYIPFIGIFIALVWGLADLAQKKHISRKFAVFSLLILLLVLGWRTHRQKLYWLNSISLFNHALDITENNSVAHTNLAMALSEKGDEEKAIAHIRVSLAINPRDVVALQGLGLYHFYRGDTAQALEELNRAAALSKSSPFLAMRVRMNLGAVYSRLGEMESAKSEYRQAIQLQPEDYKPYLNLGVHLYLEGKYSEALENLNRSISVFPTSTAYYYLGETLQAEGKLRDAEEAYRKALQISPHYDEASRALNALLAKLQASGSPAH